MLFRSVPVGCAFRPRCPYAFADCAERLPQLAVPQVEGMHIGVQGLEPDSALNGNRLPTRSQQSQVACHLYNKEGARNNG